MENTIITTTIVIGVIALAMSFTSLAVVLIKKYISRITQPDSGAPIIVSEKELEQALKRIANKDISSICDLASKKSIEKSKLEMPNLELNMYTLFQLQLLPWMTPNRMANTVTDVLGLDLSREEKQYAYYIIKSSMEKCKKSLSSNIRESIARTFKKVLEQIVI